MLGQANFGLAAAIVDAPLVLLRVRPPFMHCVSLTGDFKEQ